MVKVNKKFNCTNAKNARRPEINLDYEVGCGAAG
jgi:hypothetical protein